MKISPALMRRGAAKQNFACEFSSKMSSRYTFNSVKAAIYFALFVILLVKAVLPSL